MSGAENAKLQFRVLRRQFLFRVVDLEVLSTHALGDGSKLLGQFAALLILASVIISFGAFGILGANMSLDARLAVTLRMEHFLLATTMLVVGIFAILSWDSIFPDRRDVLVLAPLPVRARTMFAAKLAATAMALGLVVVLLHCAAGLTWPFALAVRGTGFVGITRSFAAYWFTMFAAGAFIYCGVLVLQGLASQILPRRLFLRASGFLQMTAFCLFVCAYFLEPAVNGLKMLAAPENRHLLLWSPSYWFLGFFDQLNGSMYPALVPLARRAWIGLSVSVVAAVGTYGLSYVRTMRQIVEEPDIAPSPRGVRWLPRFGNSVQTAVGQFCIRSLARSRQHRLILAFYLGLGLAFTIPLRQVLSTNPEVHGGRAVELLRQPSTPLLLATVMMTVLAVMGARVAFALPLELRANWIFRAVGVQDPGEIRIASRRALLLLSVAPVWLFSAVACLWLWQWRQAATHLIVLSLLGIIFIDIALYDFRKIPFACSYLPGKSQVHMVVIAVVLVMTLVPQSVIWEQRALLNPWTMVEMLALASLTAVGVRWGTATLAKSDETGLRFEEEAPALLELGLYRDGAVLGSRPSDPPST